MRSLRMKSFLPVRLIRQRVVDWAPLGAATLLCCFVTGRLPAWARMWLLTGSLYAGFKWLTWRRAVRKLRPTCPSPGRSLAYLLLWPGMDAARFLTPPAEQRRPPSSEWLRAIRNVAAGAALVWTLSVGLMPGPLWAVGWTALVGLGLLLHFGMLHVLALAWRRAGVDATPVMRRPILATSLTDFWGRRWNTAFRDLAYQVVYRPLARHWGARRAMAAVFLFSGILHDLAISIPARAGYGLPTLYFLVQAAGVEVERSSMGRRWRLRAGLTGWLYAAFVVLAPAGLLFHAPFLRAVILPFLNVFGA